MLRSRCQVEGSAAIATQRVTARSAVRAAGTKLTLVEAEVLDEIQLSWEDARRNIVTTGISLNALVGKRFHVGPVECVGRRLAEPCAHLEKLTRPGLLRPLVHRGGLRADILSGGTISIGDAIDCSFEIVA